MQKVKWLFRKEIDIPDEWKLIKISEFADVFSGGTPSTFNEDYWKDGNVPWINSGELKNCDINNPTTHITNAGLENSVAKLFPKNTVVIALTGVTTGNVGFLTLETSTNQSVTGIFPSQKFISKFLFYLLIFIKPQVLRFSIGTAQPHINQQIVKDLLIPFPTLPEQKKIASILSNIDELIQKQQQIIEQTQKLMEGQKQKLLIKGIDHTEFKKEPWYFQKEIEIPVGWELKEADDVCNEIVVGIVIQPAKLYVEKGIPCFRSFNIHENRINENDLVFISKESNDENPKSKLAEGDVLVVRTGYPGTACVVPKKFVGGNCIDLIIIRPKKCLNSNFMSRFINSFLAKQQITRAAAGSAQQHFNITEMKKLLIPIPPLHEQKKIASILSNLDLLIQQEKQYKEKLEKIKRGLMQQLLTGKTRVKV